MENIQYELSYTVETESDLYSPLKEGDHDRLSDSATGSKNWTRNTRRGTSSIPAARS